MIRHECDVAIVGAGPAGLAAAAEAAKHGVRAIVVDENPAAGGQYYRRRRGEAPDADARKMEEERAALLEECQSPHVTFLLETTVWGETPDGRLLLERHGRTELLQYRRLIIANGAYERVVPFPGWTLPGVMTAGGAQGLAKGGVFPGKRTLVAGSGPFLMVVATELIRSGVDVVAVLEASRQGALMRRAGLSLLDPTKGREGLRYWRQLKDAGVPIRFGHAVLRAVGEDGVEAAVIGQLDDEWRPVPGTEETVAVDTICVGFGFIPSVELPRLLGCEHEYNAARGGWVPVVDDNMQTTRDGVYVAGEVAGIGGANPAMIEGRLAALAAVVSLQEEEGRPGDKAAARRMADLKGQRRKARGFSDQLMAMFRFFPGIYDIMTDDTVVCRCEEVPLARVKGFLMDEGVGLGGVKVLSRAGMGRCQGRVCGSALAGWMARQRGEAAGEPETLNVRMPLKPVPFAAVAELDRLEQERRTGS